MTEKIHMSTPAQPTQPSNDQINAIASDYAQRWYGDDFALMDDDDKAELRIEAHHWLKCWFAVAAQPPAAPVEDTPKWLLMQSDPAAPVETGVSYEAMDAALKMGRLGIERMVEAIAKETGERIESRNRSSAESRYAATEDEVVSLGLTVQGLKAELEKALRRIEGLETLRPVWAQGYTSDSMAAQASSTALAGIWKSLGVNNQTDAMEKLRALDEPQGVPDAAPGLNAAMEIVGNMRQSEAGLFDAKHSSQRGEDRSNALYDAFVAIRSALTRPHGGGK